MSDASKLLQELDAMDIGFVPTDEGGLTLQRLRGKELDADFAARVRACRDELVVEARRREFDNRVARDLTLGQLDQLDERPVLLLRDHRGKLHRRHPAHLIAEAPTPVQTLAKYLADNDLTLVSIYGRAS